MNFLFRYKNKKKPENLYHTIEERLYSDGIKERIKDLEYESNEVQETIKKQKIKGLRASVKTISVKHLMIFPLMI